MFIESPCSTHVHSIAQGLFFLPKSEVKLRPLLRQTLPGWLKVETNSIGLIVAIHKCDDSEAFRDEAYGGHADGEMLRMMWYDNVGFDNAISIASSVLLEDRTRLAPVYGASHAPQPGHSEGLVSDGGQESAEE